jgi:hypothetical protein
MDGHDKEHKARGLLVMHQRRKLVRRAGECVACHTFPVLEVGSTETLFETYRTCTMEAMDGTPVAFTMNNI